MLIEWESGLTEGIWSGYNTDYYYAYGFGYGNSDGGGGELEFDGFGDGIEYGDDIGGGIGDGNNWLYYYLGYIITMNDWYN
jgi:hypothetical protein